MNITAVIAEYNPFHNGHALQLGRAKEETDADYVIVIMSGNFVQRGAPALLDKFTRAQAALMQGADLVIELPVLWSCASAEYFAAAGVALCAQLGCVNALCYGCETPNHTLFSDICSLLCPETAEYKKLLAGFLKEGSNYALAREKAVLAMRKDADAAAILDILENPNNILALEYQKAAVRLHAALNMHPILRRGAGYHSKELSQPYVSASAIRSYLSECADSTDYQKPLQQVMPAPALKLLEKYLAAYPLIYENDCSQMLHYALLKNAEAGFARYADCSEDFSGRICRNLDAYTNFTDFCALLKSKNMTYTRISRILTHILLNIQKDDYTGWRSLSYVPYARILGFCSRSRALLTHLKKHASIPLLTRAADAKKILPKEHALAFFEKNLFADSIYRALIMEKGGRPMRNEYLQQIIIR